MRPARDPDFPPLRRAPGRGPRPEPPAVPFWAERLQLQLDRLDGAPPSALEAEAVEFREWAADGGDGQRRRLRESVVAFANAGGGLILLGAPGAPADDTEAARAFARLNADELRRDVYAGTDPGILVETAELRALATRLLAVRIPRGLAVHTTTEGTARIRAGRRTRPLTGSGISALLAARGDADHGAATLAEPGPERLDPAQFARLRAALRKRRPRARLAALPDRELLAALRLSADGRITRAALLLLGRRDDLARLLPGHELILCRHRSDERYSVRRICREPLLEALERCREFVAQESRPARVAVGGFFDLELPDLAWSAAREALLNAVLHRDYALCEPVRLDWRDDRATVASPGGFTGGVAPHNILRHHPARRNRLLADTLQTLGFGDPAQAGVARLRAELLKWGKGPPRFAAAGAGVAVTLPTRIDANFVRFVWNEGGADAWEPDDLAILHRLQQRSPLRVTEAATLLQLPHAEAAARLAGLARRGYLAAVQQGGRWAAYRLPPPLAARLQCEPGPGEAPAAAPGNARAQLLDLISERGLISNAELRSISGLSRAQVKRHMTALREDGHVDLVGRGRAARYVHFEKAGAPLL